METTKPKHDNMAFDPAAVPSTLPEQHVVVTGAANGIGKAITKTFRASGARVSAMDLQTAHGGIVCDITNEKSVADAFDTAENAAPITCVVHAAGIAEVAPVAEASVDHFRRVVDVNLIGAFLVAREAVRRLKDGGSLLFVASQAGIRGGAYWGAYSASKGGVLRLADCLAKEMGPRCIRVNSISPGNVDTGMSARLFKDLSELKEKSPADLKKQEASHLPLQRFAQPEEIAAAAVAICSSAFSYASGSNFVLDGGELS
jgi:NAD(P)-dependent dehydrogenase (short-subunit alcohol dehydrogenase family)